MNAEAGFRSSHCATATSNGIPDAPGYGETQRRNFMLWEAPEDDAQPNCIHCLTAWDGSIFVEKQHLSFSLILLVVVYLADVHYIRLYAECINSTFE